MDRDAGGGPIRALIVHGLGRTPLAAAQLAWRLDRAGIRTSLFGYVAAVQSFEGISRRLRGRLEALGAEGPYVVIGHSLGGLLLRSAIADLPPEALPPLRLFLVGSPNRSPRLARRLKRQCLFRLLSGDAGRLLADPHRMQRIPPPAVPVTVISGVRGVPHAFKGRPNDGIVALSETRIAGQGEALRVSSLHTLLLNSSEVFGIILDHCGPPGGPPQGPNHP